MPQSHDVTGCAGYFPELARMSDFLEGPVNFQKTRLTVKTFCFMYLFRVHLLLWRKHRAFRNMRTFKR